MQVTVAIGIVGDGFDYSRGDVVEQEEFSRKVGNGWESLCAPLDTKQRHKTFETADLEPCTEKAVAFTTASRRPRK